MEIKIGRKWGFYGKKINTVFYLFSLPFSYHAYSSCCLFLPCCLAFPLCVPFLCFCVAQIISFVWYYQICVVFECSCLAKNQLHNFGSWCFPLMLNLLQITKEFSHRGAHLLCKQQRPWRCLDPFPRSSRKIDDMSVLSRLICCKSCISILPSLNHKACLSVFTCKFSWSPVSWVCRWEIQIWVVAGSIPGLNPSASRLMPVHSKKVLISPC